MKHTLLCMPQFTLRLALGWLAGWLATTLLTVACAQVPVASAQLLPSKPGTEPENHNVAFLAWHESLGTDDYTEQEVLISGSANAKLTKQP